VRPDVSPATRLHRALERNDLALVRRVAVECEAIDLEDSLRILLLIRDREPETFDRAAVRWAGQLLAACPELGFQGAHAVLSQIEALGGHERSVAASQLALRLRRAGETRSARVLERGSAG
jgi:hypothetical protein